MTPKKLNVCIECYKKIKASNGTPVNFRPLLHEDKAKMLELFNSFSPRTIYYRFLAPIRIMTDEALENYLDNDFVHAVAIVATVKEKGREKLIGVARYYTDEGNLARGEFAIVVQDDWQMLGIGTQLFLHLCDVMRAKGVKMTYALIFADNTPMFRLLDKTGMKWTSEKFDADIKKVDVAL